MLRTNDVWAILCVALFATVASAQTLTFGLAIAYDSSVNDVQPPGLVAFEFEPQVVDASSADQKIVFTVHLTDDMSGVTDGTIGGVGTSPSQVRFRSSSGQIADTIFQAPTHIVSGTSLDGVYRNTLIVPRFAEAGEWTLQNLLLVDDVGNLDWIDAQELAGRGLPTSFRVSSEQASDIDPPKVLAFDFSPKIVNTTLSDALITFTVHLTDDLSGITDGSIGGIGRGPTQVRFASASGQLADVIFQFPTHLISGNELDGLYESTMILPRFSETGIWRLQNLLLVDDVGNTDRFDATELSSRGFPIEFMVATEYPEAIYLPRLLHSR